MTAFAIYRLPLSDRCIKVEQTAGKPEEMPSLASLNGRRGFVVAPFAASTDCPVLLIRPDKTTSIAVSELPDCTDITPRAILTEADRTVYAADFQRFHSQILAGNFQKIVLSRCATAVAVSKPSLLQLFSRACRMYPRMFVALVSTASSGTWLTATPEILLKGERGLWETMALAGTMPLSDGQLSFDNPPASMGESDDKGIDWSAKNIREQRFVASYIAESIAPFAANVTEKGPYTVRAGNLVHLRSDFSFTLNHTKQLGNLLDALHPTPAVCGLPKRSALKFILDNETTPRRYYSGVIGPIDADGLTNLCVSLRCMEIISDKYRLYAGGGLVDASTETAEWLETEAKMGTMGSVIGLETDMQHGGNE